ncbi:MAG: nickel pincer cofactor biosynthesis protein LarC [Thermomicrobiales bacterium]
MRIAYFDPYSGASGDMMLGALVDVGLSLADLRRELVKLDVGGFDLQQETVSHHAIRGTRVNVVVHDDQTVRDWSAIRALIEAARLEAPIKDQALAVFSNLAEAEASVHGVDVESVHFHEVGGIDAIVDICGAAIGLALLGIERVYSGPPRVGSGFARTGHGLLPVPAPATAALLARANAPIAGRDPGGEPVAAELLTPTGAAILTTLATFSRPDFAPSAIGYGFGTMELPWPNALRVWIGEAADPNSGGDDLVLETNIDDMSPQGFELLVERLFEAGALDVWLTPATMKKGRPATVVGVLCAADRRPDIEHALIENSTTLGVRATRVERTKAARRIETVITRWGDVRVKLRGWQGRVIDVAPEYDDCASIARAADIPLRDVWHEARRIAEVYVGRRMGVERKAEGGRRL